MGNLRDKYTDEEWDKLGESIKRDKKLKREQKARLNDLSSPIKVLVKSGTNSSLSGFKSYEVLIKTTPEFMNEPDSMITPEQKAECISKRVEEAIYDYLTRSRKEFTDTEVEAAKKYSGIEDKIPFIWKDWEEAANSLARDIAMLNPISEPELIRVISSVGMRVKWFDETWRIHKMMTFAALYPEVMRTFDIKPDPKKNV